MTDEITTYVIDSNDSRLPRWKRTIAVARDGTVFAPAEIAGAETSVTVCASYDGVRRLRIDGHAFLPVEWMAREYPSAQEICAAIEKAVRQGRDSVS